MGDTHDLLQISSVLSAAAWLHPMHELLGSMEAPL